MLILLVIKGEGADVPLFETIKTNAGKKWVTAVSFGMAVASMMFIKELRRNGGKTAAIAENRHLPPNFFLPFLAELYISESFEPNLFFSKNLP